VYVESRHINQRSCSTIQLPSKYCCTPQTEVSNHEQCVRSSSARTTNKIVISGYSIYATGSRQLHQLLRKLQEDTNPGSARQQCVAARLRENGLRARRPSRGPLLTPRHRQQRLAWARTHLQWTRQRWQEVLFSDESCFYISNADGRIRVWRRQNENLAACCINEVDRRGGANVMIWAAVSFRYKSPLHFCDRSLTGQRYIEMKSWLLMLFQYFKPIKI
jgi:hypothetical protein